jgi:hypothetical protein
MSIGTKIICIDTVTGYGHKPAPWHGKRGTVVRQGHRPGTVWVQFGNVSMLAHIDNIRAA